MFTVPSLEASEGKLFGVVRDWLVKLEFTAVNKGIVKIILRLSHGVYQENVQRPGKGARCTQ